MPNLSRTRTAAASMALMPVACCLRHTVGSVDPYSERGLLRVHQTMVAGIVGSAGAFRTRGVGVIDGNGRVGRFLQTAMLGKWKEIFHAAPIENIVFENQEEYYRAIQESTSRADAGPFVDFMLERILETIKRKGVQKDVPINVPINVPIKDRVFIAVSGHPGLNRVRLAEMLAVDVKSIGRALADLGDRVEHRGSRKSGGYFVRGA